MHGATYIKRWAFAINEGRAPNIHASWNLAGCGSFYFYIFLFADVRFWFAVGRWNTIGWGRLGRR